MRYQISGPGGRLHLLGAGVEVRAGGAIRRLLSESAEPEAPVGEGLVLSLRTESAPTGTLVRLSVRNEGRGPAVIHRLLPLIFDRDSVLKLSAAGTAPWGVYKQGYQSWSYAGWRPLDGRDIHPRSVFTRTAHGDPTWAPPRRPGIFHSESMLMLGRPSGGAVLLAGFVSGARQLGRLELRSGAAAGASDPTAPLGRLEAWCEADGVALAPGESLEAEPLLVVLASEAEALEAYAGIAGQTMGARIPPQSPAVWCSWYYHFTGVTETDVLAATTQLKAVRASHPVDVIQLDDGYQAAIGDWLTPNAKFPHGLAWLAARIRDAGFIPGIWLAPFIAQRKSRLYREHPEWFVKNPQLNPVAAGWNPSWNDVTCALDTTHPAVQGWLYGLVTSLVEAGFGYLKLDFLYGAAMPGMRHDRKATRASALHKGLEVIRQAAGDQVFLLGCGSPMLPAVGLVDGMRVGPDVAPTWRFKFLGLPILQAEPGTSSARNALQMALGRQWMHGRLWANDPDSMILRTTETQLTEEEARSVASVAALSGGILSFSDQPGTLPPDRLDWLRRMLPAARSGIQPLTLLAEPNPFLSVSRQGEWTVVLAYNGEDRARPLDLRWTQLGLPEDCHVYDSWAARYLGRHTAGITLPTVPAHGSRVLAIRPAGPEPLVVGTSLHLHPGAAFSSCTWDGLTLQVRLTRPLAGRAVLSVAGGSAHVVVPGATVTARRHGSEGDTELILEGGDTLWTHGITLTDGELRLRPMTEEDWPVLVRWENDPEVLFYAETEQVLSRTVEEVQDLYRWVSQHAYLFVMEANGQPLGSCWLQEMNLDRIKIHFRGKDLRRIDLAIGEKEHWGNGLGTRAIRLLTELAFSQGADAVFGVDIQDYNPRSRRAFEKAGFSLVETRNVPQPAKGKEAYDLVIWRQ